MAKFRKINKIEIGTAPGTMTDITSYVKSVEFHEEIPYKAYKLMWEYFHGIGMELPLLSEEEYNASEALRAKFERRLAVLDELYKDRLAEIVKSVK